MRTLSLRFGLVVLVGCVAVGSTQAYGFGSAALNGYGGFSVRANSGFSAGAYQGFGAGSYSFSGSGGIINRGGGGFLYSGPNTGRYNYNNSVDGFNTVGPVGGSSPSFGGSSLSVSGTRGAAVGPYGGAAPGGSLGYAAGTSFPTDVGLANSSAGGGFGAVGSPTAFWSYNYLASWAGVVRNGFAAYNSFNPTWYTLHPKAWVASGWAANAAWAPATWSSVVNLLNITATAVYLDYGNTIVYQNGMVLINGIEVSSVQAFNQQATELAVTGQDTKPAKTDQWQALGVFALARGDEQTSNTVFQLAINQNGIIRGNYYDAMTDTNTEVYGSVDVRTQWAAWIIGNNKTRVFETGIYNLTRNQTPVLVHLPTGNTQQWLFVRLAKPKPQGE